MIFFVKPGPTPTYRGGVELPSHDRDRRRLAATCAEALEADAEEGGGRCDDLVQAASYWRAAGRPERERRTLLAAVEADDGRGFFDARSAYGEFLMAYGHNAAAEALFAELLHQQSAREQTYLNAAGAFEEAGQHRQALRWLNVGIHRLVPHIADPGTDLAGGDAGYELLHVRRRLRRILGEPPDALDEIFDDSQRRGNEVLTRIQHLRTSHD